MERCFYSTQVIWILWMVLAVSCASAISLTECSNPEDIQMGARVYKLVNTDSLGPE